MDEQLPNVESGSDTSASWLYPALSGFVVAAVSWAVVFELADPLPRTSGFDWAATVVFGSVTVFGILAIILGSSSFAFRAHFFGLATAGLMWHNAVPSTTDGFAGAYWVVIAVLAIASLSIVVGFSALLDRLQHREHREHREHGEHGVVP